MGNCAPGKSSSKKQKIKLNIKWTGIYDIDELFRAAAEPLQTLHDVSSSITKSSKALKKATFTHVIVDCTLTDSIIGMLYVFSANSDGVIKHLEFMIESESPYIFINKKKLPVDVVNIYEAWEAVCSALKTAPGKLEDLSPQIQNLIEESKEFPDRAKDICTRNNLGPMDTLKACKRVMKNANKIANAKKVIEETRDMIQAMMKAIEAIPNCYEQNKSRIETTGESAIKANLLLPKLIIPEYWPEKARVNMKLDVPPKPKTQKK